MTKNKLLDELSAVEGNVDICIESDDGDPIVIRSIVTSSNFIMLSGCRPSCYEKNVKEIENG